MKFKTATLAHTNGNKFSHFSIEEIGDDHIYTGLETPMKADAFLMSDGENT